MAEPSKPVLQKPPGYRDPSIPRKPVPSPIPRKAYLPPSFHSRTKRRSCCRICCCISCITIAALLFIMGITGVIFFLWFDPKLPVFHMQSFKISTFDVTARQDGTYLNAVTVARVEVRNPNTKLTYRYGVSEVGVTVGHDQGTELGSTSLAGFTQAKTNTASLKIETRVKNELLEDRVGSRLKAHYKSRELVVNLLVTTSVGLGVVDGVEIGMLGVDVLCDGITLKQIDAGEMPRCAIRTLKWINID